MAHRCEEAASPQLDSGSGRVGDGRESGCGELGDCARYALREDMTLRIVADPFPAKRAILDEIDFPELPPAR
ncbi:MAG: hypothetical protein VX681_05445 [Myxococcota bacterium]|nr:hypothetical protein [Myxococcota bacterium]